MEDVSTVSRKKEGRTREDVSLLARRSGRAGKDGTYAYSKRAENQTQVSSRTTKATSSKHLPRRLVLTQTRIQSEVPLTATIVSRGVVLADNVVRLVAVVDTEPELFGRAAGDRTA